MDVMRLTSVQQVAWELGKGLRSVEGQQVNVRPRLVYHKECVQCIQSKQQLVTWSVIMQVENGSSAIIPQHFSFYFEDSLTFWNATILCDCPRYIIHIHFLTALVMLTTPQQNFPSEVDFCLEDIPLDNASTLIVTTEARRSPGTPLLPGVFWWWAWG